MELAKETQEMVAWEHLLSMAHPIKRYMGESPIQLIIVWSC
jgi:hypothetical protein